MILSEYVAKNAFDYVGNSYTMNSSVLGYMYGPRPLSAITKPRDKVYLEIDHTYNTPGHGGKGEVDGHVGGPFCMILTLTRLAAIITKKSG